MTPPPGSQGGLLNAIYGSAVMTVLGILIGSPIGVLAGTYLAEYGRNSRLSTVIRFINDVLLSAPSIIVGLFIYEIVVVRMGHFSAHRRRPGAGGARDPGDPAHHGGHAESRAHRHEGFVRRARRVSLAHHLERAVSGGPQRHRHRICCWPIARISGETAPLLFTALNNQFWSTNLNAPMANLPVVIFQFALSPYKDWQDLAWAGALIITVTILMLSISARVLLALLQGDAGFGAMIPSTKPPKHLKMRVPHAAGRRNPPRITGPAKIEIRAFEFLLRRRAFPAQHHHVPGGPLDHGLHRAVGLRQVDACCGCSIGCMPCTRGSAPRARC